MRGYLAILFIRMKMLFQYRAAAFAGICTQLFWGVIYIMIFKAFYENAGKEPISLNQTITFIWLSQALIQIFPWSIDKQIEAQIKNGNIAYELLRPIHLYGLWFARSFAMRFAPTALRCLPIFIFGGMFLGLSAPISWEAGGTFLLSVILALFLSSAITSLIITSLFWTLSGEGIQRLMPSFALFFSGAVIPLPLFPGWMQPFLNVQPFRGIMDIPCRLYTGIIPTQEAFYYLSFQLAWILAIVFLGQWLARKAVRQFIIQGG